MIINKEPLYTLHCFDLFINNTIDLFHFVYNFYIYLLKLIDYHSTNIFYLFSPFMTLSNEILQNKFTQLKQTSGSFVEKMKGMGFVYNGNKQDASTFEEFKEIVENCEYMDDAKLQKYYGDFLTYKDVIQILSVGDYGFDDNELAEAMKIIPVTPQLQISVKDFVKIVYQ